MFRLTGLALALSASSLAIIALPGSPVGAADTTSTQAVLAGKLGYEGGAKPNTFHPTSGTVIVDFDSTTPLSLERHVGPSGNFRISLPPGSYTVIGCGPSDSSGAARVPCSTPTNLTLTSGEVAHIKLIWAYAK